MGVQGFPMRGPYQGPMALDVDTCRFFLGLVNVVWVFLGSDMSACTVVANNSLTSSTHACELVSRVPSQWQFQSQPPTKPNQGFSQANR